MHDIVRTLINVWSDYSELEFRWLEIILTKPVLSHTDMARLFNACKVAFLEESQEGEVSLGEMGRRLLNSVKKKVLFNKIKKLIQTNYSNKFSYAEAEIFCKRLEDCDPKLIRKIYLSISRNEIMRKFLLDDKNLNHCTKCQLVFYILEELYKNDSS